jgi:hypothetical protein
MASVESEFYLRNFYRHSDGHFESVDTFLKERLSVTPVKTLWPRETTIDFDIDSQNALIKLAVDLPEIEDMPNIYYKLNKRGG